MQSHSALWVGNFCGVRLSQRARALRFRLRIRSRHAEGLIGVLVDEDVDVGLAEEADIDGTLAVFGTIKKDQVR